MDIIGQHSDKERDYILTALETTLLLLFATIVEVNLFFHISEITTYRLLLNLVGIPLEVIMAFVYFREGWNDNKKRVKRTIRIALKTISLLVILLIASFLFPIFAAAFFPNLTTTDLPDFPLLIISLLIFFGYLPYSGIKLFSLINQFSHRGATSKLKKSLFSFIFLSLLIAAVYIYLSL